MRSVHELTQDELEELRSRWYHIHIDDGSLQEIMGTDDEVEEDLIPVSVVIDYYRDTLFVDEDFWCNLKDEEE